MKVLITFGGTTEHIDRVRVIKNSSTGTLGVAIANAFLEAKCNVHCLKAFDALKPLSRAKTKEFTTTSELEKLLKDASLEGDFDIVIHAAAISDYTVKKAVHFCDIVNENCNEKLEDLRNTNEKLPSNIEDLTLVMQQTPKLIASLRKDFPQAKIVGFKLLVNATLPALEEAAFKLITKNDLDYAVSNDSTKIDNKTGYHEALLVAKNGTVQKCFSNAEIAKNIVSCLL